MATSDVRFSAGGAGPFAQVEQPSGAVLELGWAGQLPKPEIDGSRAIYRGVVADGAGDLVATALPTGLRFDVVLNRRPTGPVEIKVPVTGKGLEVSKEKGSRLTVKEGDKVVAVSSTPVMYDATSPLAAHSRKSQQFRTLQGGQERVGDIATEVAASGEGKTLILKPSTEFLANPATAYPVTVDPSVVLPLNDDTDVNSAFDGNNVSGEYLKAGTETDGEKARTYLRFDTRGLKTPTNAVLKLTNIDAPSCGPTVSAGIQVRRITSHWDATTQTWTPQPSNTTEDAVISTEGSQLGSCGSGTMTWNVTPIVAKWAAGTPNHGFVLQSPTEAKQANYRIFASAENTDGLAAPILQVTSDEVITPGEGDDPADPGPADFKPGHVEPLTGNWITSAIDLTDDGLMVTRNHTAGQRVDAVRDNEAVLGPNWQLEPLGGVLGNRLKDFTANGYIEIALNIGTEHYRFQLNPDGTYTSTDGGGTLVKNADGTFTQTLESADLVYTWTKVGQEYLVTAVGGKDSGKQLIEYETTGRFTRIISPPTPDSNCVSAPAACSTATFQYATTTTATSSTLGDVAGQLKTISYDAAGDTAAVTAVSYKYDSAKRLRQVEDSRQADGDPVRRSTYAYDVQGNITSLTTAEDGTWTLTYSAPGKMTSATAAAGFAVAATSCPAPSAADYMLYGRCQVRVDVLKGAGYDFRTPLWKGTYTGGSVMGITNDGCSSVPNKPYDWVSFKAACDSHDYGYGLIRNKMNGEANGLPKSKRAAVDAVFYTILKERICAKMTGTWRNSRGYPISKKVSCLDSARMYYNGVRAFGGSAL
ncbi:phospholipase A2 [Sphaerisporangium sp. NPDC049002]|uniref:phospholipase A2 n=1 Tax=Sphaerisporangium sp. NPDC049002 TaxID=3155392 RepID=UPI0033F21C81